MLRRSVLLKVWLFEQKCAFTWQSHTVLALSIFGVAGEMGMEWLEIQLHWGCLDRFTVRSSSSDCTFSYQHHQLVIKRGELRVSSSKENNPQYLHKQPRHCWSWGRGLHTIRWKNSHLSSCYTAMNNLSRRPHIDFIYIQKK